jgi:hypothetical protein
MTAARCPTRRGPKPDARATGGGGADPLPHLVRPLPRPPLPRRGHAAALEAQARAWREDRQGYVALGVRDWKHAHHRSFFETTGARVSFHGRHGPRRGDGRPVQVWASREDDMLAPACAREGRPLCGWRTVSCAPAGWARGWCRPCRWCRTTWASTTTRHDESRLERLIAEAARMEPPAEAGRAADRHPDAAEDHQVQSRRRNGAAGPARGSGDHPRARTGGG